MTGRLRCLSLQGRLVIGTVILMAFGLTVADIAGLALMRSYQLQRIDQQLTTSSPGLSESNWDINAEQLCSFSFPTRTQSSGGPQLPTPLFFAVLDHSGTPLCRVPSEPTSLGAPNLDVLDQRLADIAAAQQPVTTPNTDPGAPWRVRIITINDGYAIIAISLADALETAARLQLTTIVISAIVILLAGVGGWFVVRLGLRPLTKIEETANAITGGDLSQRVEPAPPAATEVGRVAASMNTMLDQLERSFDERLRTEDRLRQFLADASHELRTPLASIRGHAEMYRQGVATTPQEVAVVMNRIESESIRMGDLVNDLLLLARLDTRPGLSSQRVDLLAVAADVLVDARVRDPQRPVQLIQLEGHGWDDIPPVVSGDEARIRQILTNLVSNVLRHTPAGSPYEVTIGSRAGRVQVNVIDHGPGLRPDTAARVFERFYRDDQGRTRNTGGAGLGLSIVAGLVAAHGGTATHQPTPGGGSTFTLDLPQVSTEAREPGRVGGSAPPT